MYVIITPAATLFEINIEWALINHLEICNLFYEDRITSTEEIANNLSAGINAII